MRITRRHLLAATAILAVGGTVGAAATGAHWWDQPVTGEYRFLSADEASFLDAVAEAVFPAGGEPPLGGREAAVGRFLDEVLAGIPATQRNLLRAAFHAVDSLPLVTNFSRFSALPLADAQAVFRDWLNHERPEIRGIAQSLHVFVGMAYLTHPEVAPLLAGGFDCGWGR